jgi:hypothetical protein
MPGNTIQTIYHLLVIFNEYTAPKLALGMNENLTINHLLITLVDRYVFCFTFSELDSL